MTEPATFAITRVMRPGHEQDYDRWVGQLIAALPAAVGATRLDQAGGIHHLLLHFPDRAALTAWQAGEAWIGLRLAAERFSVGLNQAEDGRVIGVTLPSEAAAAKWKTAIVTWAGVVPTLLAVSAIVQWAAPWLPRIAQQIVSSILLTAALTWVILPRVRGWSRFWMMQDSAGRLRRKAD